MLFVQKKSGRGFLPGWWLILGVSCLLATLAAAADYPSLPLRGRSSALLAALFHHDALGESNRRTALPADAGGGQFFTSASPVKVATAAERAKVVDFANSLVYEGGFFPSEIYDLLGIDNATTSRVARLTRQLDRAEKRSPAPWEVAGRISRSGLAGSSDNWSMSPGELGEEGLSSPGTLAYLPVLALAYAAYPEDGLEAAEQLAILKDDDLRAAAAARGAAG
ncbi:MAG: hypothetical protein LBU79_09915, partial [Planctomycetota bacterium]|nr:hypothetical protein [Planctomycetota bacterium]